MPSINRLEAQLQNGENVRENTQGVSKEEVESLVGKKLEEEGLV
jgi:hypothetical protein